MSTLGGGPHVPRARIEDPDYWRSLHPRARVSETPWPQHVGCIPFSAGELEDYRRSLRHEGYFQTPSRIPESDLDRLAACVSSVMAAGHSPGYALVYDDFFQVLASLGVLLTGILGRDFQMVPDEPDVYFIPTADAASGTPPHRDSLRFPEAYDPLGVPTLVNLWIPITDATPENSCMYVVPAHLDPGYRHEMQAASQEPSPEVGDLQCVRALPATAGSVLGWSTGLLHWGGFSSDRAEFPRLSFAMYFQSRDARPFHPSTTSLPYRMPFATRLYLIEKTWRDPDGLEAARYLGRGPGGG